MRAGASLVTAALIAATASGLAHADQPRPSELADRFNEEGRELFGRGELEQAIKKFRAAIAVDPQARYFFNLCFVLNARYQLEAALGACEAVADADGADDRLKARAADLIEVIKKKKAQNEKPPEKPEPVKVTDEQGEPVLESKPLPPDGGDRVATAEPRRYPPPIGKTGAVRVVTPSQPQRPERKMHIGLLGGFTFASLNEQIADTSSDTTSGVTVGAFVASPLSRIIAGQVELVYVQRGGGVGTGISTGDNVRFDYMSIPAIGKFQLPLGRTGRAHLDLGLSVSLLVNTSETMENVSRFEAGWVIGGGFTYHRRGGPALILDLRHESGLTDVDSVDVVQIRNKTWTLRLGYGF